jgi:hypothetical protein
VKSLSSEEVRLVTEALGADVWPTEMFQSLTFAFYRQLLGGEFPVHSPKVDKDVEEPRLIERYDRRWKQQVEIAGVCKRRKGRNVRR